jgi:CARDB
MDAPASVVQGGVVSVDVTVENVGNQDVYSDIIVTLTYDTDGLPIGDKTISGGLIADASTTLTFSWDTTSVSIGDHTLTASHNFADGDLNNSMSTGVEITTEGSTNIIYVASIEMEFDGKIAGKNEFVWVIATVTVVDAADDPVEDATVYGHWEDATTDTDSGITDSVGKAFLASDEVKNPPSGTKFTFVVDSVTKYGWVYDPESNVEIEDSITVP